MPNPLDELKKTLETGLHETIGDLWNSPEDKKFLTYNAEKVAKYVLLLNSPTATQEQKDEAQFNLDNLKTSVAMYLGQRAIRVQHNAEKIAGKVFELLVGVLKKKFG